MCADTLPRARARGLSTFRSTGWVVDEPDLRKEAGFDTSADRRGHCRNASRHDERIGASALSPALVPHCGRRKGEAGSDGVTIVARHRAHRAAPIQFNVSSALCGERPHRSEADRLRHDTAQRPWRCDPGEKTRSACATDTRDRAGLISRFASAVHRRLKSHDPRRIQTYRQNQRLEKYSSMTGLASAGPVPSCS